MALPGSRNRDAPQRASRAHRAGNRGVPYKARTQHSQRPNVCRAVDHHAPLSIITVHRPVCALNCHCGLERCGDIEPEACYSRYSGYSAAPVVVAPPRVAPHLPRLRRGRVPHPRQPRRMRTTQSPTAHRNSYKTTTYTPPSPDSKSWPPPSRQPPPPTITTDQHANAQQREQEQKLKIMSRLVE